MNDHEIIDLYFARSERAIVETATKYGSYLSAIAYRILHSENDAEEVVNDTYHSAWRSMPPKRPDVLKLFLARIARNIAIDRLEYRLAQKRNSDRDVLLSEISEALPVQYDVEEVWSEREIGETINQFLRQSDPKSRTIFIARYFYAYSIREISERMGYSQSYIKNSLFRMRKKLKAYLNEKGVSV